MVSQRCGVAALAWLLALVVPLCEAADRALLIGVSEYPYLAGQGLQGPRNDVRLMVSTLGAFGFVQAQVSVLADAPGALPTRANILGQMQRLADQSAAGDWVVVYFSGHGSQVPQRNPGAAAYREPDGLDEVFLPRDTRRWDRKRRVVEGALTDDDIGLALARITAMGANVWAIFDTCHAADMTRGAAAAAAAPVMRFVPPELLGVPAARLARKSAVTPIARDSRIPLPPQADRPTPHGGQLIAFFASQSDEGAAEEMLDDPEHPGQKQRFGVFTHQLHKLATTGDGSFRDLAAQLIETYRPRPFPTPEFAGPLDMKLPLRERASTNTGSLTISPMQHAIGE
jgi:hypothetical protein